MNKSKIPEEEGKLKWLCNEAFFGVKKILPKKFKNSEDYDGDLAIFLGIVSGYATAKSGEILVQTVNSYGYSLNLESIASHGLYVTALAPIIASLVAPNYVTNFIRENPIYSSGVAGVMIGASAKALEVLLS